MAGDWIKVELTLPDKPEVIGISNHLGIDPDAVVGKLLRLWIWADQNLENGHARSVTQKWIDCHVRCEHFAEAMVFSGWLAEENGGVTFPNFERHLSQTSKRRALALRRKRQERSRSERDKSVTREERREKRVQRKKDTPLPPFPPELDTDEFRAVWAVWDKHRREIRKPLTPTSITQQLRQLAAWGPARAIAAINHTVAKGWQGLREPDAEMHRDKRPTFEEGLL